MFSNSKMSEMDLRGGQHFSNKSEIQKSLKYPIGGGVKIRNTSQPSFKMAIGVQKGIPFFPNKFYFVGSSLISLSVLINLNISYF